MNNNQPVFDVVLASGSPRRRQLLQEAGVAFTVQVADVDETLEPQELAHPQEACCKLAFRKAYAVVQQLLGDSARTEPFLVIGSDTMVVCDGEIFGKPQNEADAHRMLSRLAGRSHEVMTSVSLLMVANPSAGEASMESHSFVDVSVVTFKTLTSRDIEEYLAVGESFDKAGAYAIQGEGARLVSQVQGSMDTVIGLPAQRLMREYGDVLLPVKA